MTTSRSEASTTMPISLAFNFSPGTKADRIQNKRAVPPVRTENRTSGDNMPGPVRSLQKTMFSPYMAYTVVAAAIPSQVLKFPFCTSAKIKRNDYICCHEEDIIAFTSADSDDR